MRVCDNCLGRAGTVTSIRKDLAALPLMHEFCMHCMDALDVMDWRSLLQRRQELRASYPVGHRE